MEQPPTSTPRASSTSTEHPTTGAHDVNNSQRVTENHNSDATPPQPSRGLTLIFIGVVLIAALAIGLCVWGGIT